MPPAPPPSYRHLVLYEIYVRSHGPRGRFDEVTADLPRIRAMGVDYLWLMPIHPIGQIASKGPLGCPYSITDYRKINPEYGTLDDFRQLVAEAHDLGLRVMMDLVFNHMAHDSVWAQQRPEWFRRNAEGKAYCTVAEWTDVVELQYGPPELQAEILDIVEYWVRLGVDGFRCDVAPLVPMELWRACRQRAAQLGRDILWLAESATASWVADRRRRQLPILSDGELYSAFDITYDYDIWNLWQAAVVGQVPVSRYVEAVRFQDCRYPDQFLKLRAVENHDQPRIMALAPGAEQARAWTAFQAFNEGVFLLYAGQEASARTTPSLFAREPIEWQQYALQGFLTKLCHLRRHPTRQQGQFHFVADTPALVAAWSTDAATLLGIFNVEGRTASVHLPLPDGTYEDLLQDRQLQVAGQQVALPEDAAIVEVRPPLQVAPPYCPLLDFGS